jgi:hypothetical protein
VAVLGVPNQDLGEEVKAVVPPAHPASGGPDRGLGVVVT